MTFDWDIANREHIARHQIAPEEANWWDNHPEESLSVFESAAQDGSLGRGTLAGEFKETATSISLDQVDIELATRQANERGIAFQAYLKMLIHQALSVEAAAVSSTRR